MEKMFRHEPVTLARFDLRQPDEWRRFERVFRAYLAEVCGAEEYRENLAELEDPVLNRQLVDQTLREDNPYFVMRIEWRGACAGIISYSYRERERVGFINNVYLSPEYRNRGIGAASCLAAEEHLRGLGARSAELVPVESATRFYRHGGYLPVRINADGEQVYGKTLV